MSRIARAGSLLWRHRKWWLGPLIATAALFSLLWWHESGKSLPQYIYGTF